MTAGRPRIALPSELGRFRGERKGKKDGKDAGKDKGKGKGKDKDNFFTERWAESLRRRVGTLGVTQPWRDS